ncbi:MULTISPECIES: VOC family protein [Arthrobacter]|uniref:VOC family protein n=1 Tax=Arthrobacter terricola TaxID=2547396 RepID=A0A4R5KF92_9MICC|nr:MULTISPECIES: VOC family protein [Arthrobacter]MBT8162122.1 VOC family protein [Arthrobacter sp. GN70]TDF93936.1 VOC family protein [Arthrobacter terricola]
MALNFQVVVDCNDPHTLADWWAETLEWVVEPQDEAFIRSMVEQGFATDEETTTHNGKLVWKTGAAIIPSEDQDKATGKRVLFQAVPEGKSTKNRIHLDVRLAGQDKDVVRAALEARGAKHLWTAGQGPHEWHTMADPEGNEFCIS